MNDARLRQLRRGVRRGELAEDLLKELRTVVQRLVRLRLLPPSFAPYGRWDEEAAAEIFNAWYTDRLLGRGHLQALLDRANTVGAFHRLCERSLRQHLLNTQDRSQARNLFVRLMVLLNDDPSFVRTRDAARSQDRWYFLATGDDAPHEFAGEDSVLVAHGWAVGDLTVIRYRAAAQKLSPVLDAAELKRFTAALLEGVGCALTPTLIMRALSARLDLGEVRVEQLEELGPASAPAGIVPPDEQLALRETALALLGEMSARQALILRRTAAEETVAQIAAAAGCSTGTVVNEQRRVGQLLSRMSENDVERDQLLNILADLVYSPTDE